MQKLSSKIYFYLVARFLSALRRVKYCLNPKIKIGKRVFLGRGVGISTRYGGMVVIGDKCDVHSYAQILTQGGNYYRR